MFSKQLQRVIKRNKVKTSVMVIILEALSIDKGQSLIMHFLAGKETTFKLIDEAKI